MVKCPVVVKAAGLLAVLALLALICWAGYLMMVCLDKGLALLESAFDDGLHNGNFD